MDDTTTRSVAPRSPTQVQLAGLVTSQSFVAAMLDAIEAGIVACDADGTLVLFNRATREFHGLPQERIAAEAWAEHYDLFHADGTTPMVMADVPLFRALAGHEVVDQPMVIAPAVGQRRTLRASGQQIVGPDGEVLGAVVAMHDVTALQAVEQELRAQRERVRAAEQSREHVAQLRALHRASLRVLAASDTTTAMHRLVEETADLLGPGRVTLSWTDGTAEREASFGGRGGAHATEVPLRLDGGVVGMLVLDAEEQIGEDDLALLDQLATVGAQVLHAGRLRGQLGEAETARMRDELMAGVSHDMQTPLGAVVGLIETLVARDGELEETERREVLAAIGRQAGQLRMLVGQFLDYTRLSQRHELALRPAPVDVAAIARRVALLHGHTGRVGTDLLAEPVPAAVDEARVQRVIGNLVANALAYASGAVLLRVRVEDDHVVVEVCDDGPGLGADPEGLFAKFTRGGQADARDGAGLGLYVGRAVAEAHGGTLTAANGADGGAVLTLRLPRRLEP